MIVVKGMDEMPDTCEQCPLSVSLFGKIHCPYLARRVAWGKRDDKCPLVILKGREGLESRWMVVDEIEPTPGDAVSREAALNALNCDVVIEGKENMDTVYDMLETFIMRIKALPPAQPETHDKRTETHACENTCDFERKSNDMISRQDAIDTLNEYFARIGKLKRRGLTKGEKAISLDTVGAIKSLPSAQPKRTDKRTETHGVCLDAIDRQAAIDALDDIESEVSRGLGFQYEKWRKHFTDLSSIQSESCHGCLHEPRYPLDEPCATCSNNYVNKWRSRNA